MGKVAGSAGRGSGGRYGARRGATAQLGAPQGAVVEVLPPRMDTRIPPARTGNALLTPSSEARVDGSAAYTFRTASGNRVRMGIGSTGTIAFTINDSTTRNPMSQNERNAVSLRLLQHIRQDAKTRPDGFQYNAVAAGGDGYQGERARAYAAIGLSRPLYGIEGRKQYGVVQNGRIRPDNARLQAEEGYRFSGANASWAATQRQAQRARAEKSARRSR